MSAVHRFEDYRLLTGNSRYVEDLPDDGCLHAVFVRSTHAHARIRSLDVMAATSDAGVHDVLIGQRLVAEGVMPLVCSRPMESSDGTPFFAPTRHALAVDTVRYVGEPIAMVVATTLPIAMAAADLVNVDYEALPAVLRPEDSSEVAVLRTTGDPAGVAAAFEQASEIVKVKRKNPRVSALPLETRSAIGQFDSASGTYRLDTQTQGVHLMRTLVAATLGIDESRLRVVTPDVGGSFGMKLVNYPEQTAVLVAARLVDRRVRWVSTRGEALMSDTQARDHDSTIEIAFDDQGMILGLRAYTHGNMGAYASAVATSSPVVGFTRTLPNVYRVPAIEITTRAAYTHTVPTDAFRGAGKPEGVHLMERAMDSAALALGIDRMTLRQRNLVTAAQMPYAAANGETWDCGDFPAAMEAALRHGMWTSFESRRTASAEAGRLRGFGLGMYLHTAGAGTAETSMVELDSQGQVHAYVGQQNIGQAHETTFAQLLAGHLGIRPDAVNVIQGDTDRLPPRGASTGGSASLQCSGTTLLRAADVMLGNLHRHAAATLEAAASDVQYQAGAFCVPGTDLAITLSALGRTIPDEARDDCNACADFEGSVVTIPNGAYVCEVEVDPDTGDVSLCKFVGVDDVGRRINSQVVDGQLHGSIAHGLGQAWMEIVSFDPQTGQLMSGSLMDYAVPRAEHFPNFELHAADIPTSNNSLGAKGVGEVGCFGAPAAFMNAIADAIGTQDVEMPATPETVWRALMSVRRR